VPTKLVRKIAAAKKEAAKARVGKNSFPQPPSFLPARAEKFSALPREARQSKFKVRIFVKKGSDFNQKVPPVGKRGYCLALAKGSPADFRHKVEFFCLSSALRDARSGLFFFLIEIILFGNMIMGVKISFTIILPKLY